MAAGTHYLPGLTATNQPSVQTSDDAAGYYSPGDPIRDTKAPEGPISDRWSTRKFEARLVMVDIPQSPSIFFTGMTGSRLPIVTAHGEGRAHFDRNNSKASVPVAMRYIDGERPAERYPANPNGSPDGITGLTTPDGRFTIVMPHPERVFRSVQMSWHPPEWGEDSPWLRMFRNARVWVN